MSDDEPPPMSGDISDHQRINGLEMRLARAENAAFELAARVRTLEAAVKKEAK